MARTVAIWRGGPILDASIAPVPRNHNHPEENAAIKAGEVPDGWKDKPARMARKDVDACWSEEGKKTVRWTVFPRNENGKSHFCCKNHVNVDRRHKFVRRWHVTDAAVHDSPAVDERLTRTNTARHVWADRHCRAIGPSDNGDADRSAEIEGTLQKVRLRSRIHRKGHRNRRLNERGKPGNRTASPVA